MQLEALLLAVNGASTVVNARGALLKDRLRDNPVRTVEIVFHGVRHGAAVALAAA